MGIVAALVCALLVAGCGAEDDGAAAGAQVKRGDLARMVLPRGDVGAQAWGLKRASRSGRTTNREAAAGTLDPKDTGRALRRQGRMDGYRLSFARRDRRRDVVGITTEVELFRTESAAARYLAKQFADVRRFRGRRMQGLRVGTAEPFDVDDLGDGAQGVRVPLTGRRGRARAYATTVGFRSGGVVGSASAVTLDDLEMRRMVEGMARQLRDRIQRVSARRTLRRAERRVARRTRWRAPDPETRTLTAAGLGLGQARLRHQNHLRRPAMRAYWRDYVLASGRIGRSRPLGVRTLTQVYRRKRAAIRQHRSLGTREGAATIARGYLNGAFAPRGFLGGGVDVEGRRSGDTTWARFKFDVRRGPAEGVLVTVRRGRMRTGVLVWGMDRRMRAADIVALRGVLRAQLRG